MSYCWLSQAQLCLHKPGFVPGKWEGRHSAPASAWGGQFCSLPSSHSLNCKFSLGSTRRCFCSSSDGLISSGYPEMHAKAVNSLWGDLFGCFGGEIWGGFDLFELDAEVKASL